jgi:aspartate aminotransferase-like enzyme
MTLWIPGPTEVRPSILAELARPPIGHRSAGMKDLHHRIDGPLALAFGLAPDSPSTVAVHSASGTAIMEAALLGVGDRVLSLINGAFSKRFAAVAEALGKEVTRIEVPMGQVVDPMEVAQALDTKGPFDAMTVVSSETSTGTATPLAPLAKVLENHPNVRFLVDVVSMIAAGPIDFDTHRVDFALAGVQKALALPPGIAVMCCSERYLAEAQKRNRPSWYLDPVRIIEGHAAQKTPATPAVPHYYALAQQLEDISAGVTLPKGHAPVEGPAAWQARYEVHSAMRARTAEWAEGHGLSLLPAPEFAAPAVSCIQAGKLNVAALVAGLAEEDYSISNGYGDLKGKTFRIGHMGDHTLQELEELLAAADKVIARL